MAKQPCRYRCGWRRDELTATDRRSIAFPRPCARRAGPDETATLRTYSLFGSCGFGAVIVDDSAVLRRRARRLIGVRALPRYVYECTKCAHTYEKREGWDAKPKQRCPECRAISIRIPATPAIVFKGSGWYSTDNRRTLRDGADSLNDGGDDGPSGSDGSSNSSSEGSSNESGSGASEGGGSSGGESKKTPAKAKSESDS